MAIIFRIRIPNVNEGHPRYSVGRTLSTNLVYTIWAVFGGFILHFLLSNYLTVLLRPNYKEPVDTAAELVNRNITLILQPNQNIYRQIFANSPDPIYQELSRTLKVAGSFNSYRQYAFLARNGPAGYTGEEYAGYAVMFPRIAHRGDHGHYSSETVKGRYHFPGSISNKKWPLKKVFKSLAMKQHK